MKIELHIPVEQYGFVGAEMELAGTPPSPEALELVRETYDAIKNSFAAKQPLPEKEMGEFLYAQIHGLGNHVETWEKMSQEQKTVVKLLKNALARKKPTNVTN